MDAMVGSSGEVVSGRVSQLQVIQKAPYVARRALKRFSFTLVSS